MKNHNIPILLIVVALVAVAARFTHPKAPRGSGTEDATRDLAVCLRLLWQEDHQQVSLQPLRDGYLLQAQVTMPRATRMRQQRWNYPFLRFAASRHPQTPIAEIEVHDLSNNSLIPQSAMNGLLADRIAPRAEGGDEERAALLTSRQLTAGLDELVGGGQSLVLVDALSVSSQSGQPRYGKIVSQQPIAQPFDYVVCVVTKQPIATEKWERYLRTYLASVRNPRQVVLP